jgi:hypothetical protein
MELARCPAGIRSRHGQFPYDQFRCDHLGASIPRSPLSFLACVRWVNSPSLRCDYVELHEFCQLAFHAGFLLRWHAKSVSPCRLAKPLVPATLLHQALRSHRVLPLRLLLCSCLSWFRWSCLHSLYACRPLSTTPQRRLLHQRLRQSNHKHY